jgi:hypothetical protein
MYYTLSAYGIISESLEISLIISDLIKDTIIEQAGRLYDLDGRHYINMRNVSGVLKTAGLTVEGHHYYRWCIEQITDADA